MTEAHNIAFIAKGLFVRTANLDGNVWMIGRIDAPLHVIMTQVQVLLFSITNNTFVVAAIHFVSVSTTNPNTVLWWYLISWVLEINKVTMSDLECCRVVGVTFILDSVEIR